MFLRNNALSHWISDLGLPVKHSTFYVIKLFLILGKVCIHKLLSLFVKPKGSEDPEDCSSLKALATIKMSVQHLFHKV
jgi:hypothetical protein